VTTLSKKVKKYAHSETITETVRTQKREGRRLECGHATEIYDNKKDRKKISCLLCKYPGEFDREYPKEWEYMGIVETIYDWVDE
jgi:hypothetical protein